MSDRCVEERSDLRTHPVHYPVNGGPGHVKGPGQYPIGGGAGKPEKKHQSGDLWAPTVVTLSAHYSHEGIEGLPGEPEVDPQVTVAVKVQCQQWHREIDLALPPGAGWLL